MNGVHGHGTGFSLVEILVALLIAALLTLGIVQITQAATAAYQLQRNLSALQENARFALQMIEREVTQAGFRHQPWQAPRLHLLEGSADNISRRGDRLTSWRWSDRNCFENRNPAKDGNGQPRFYLRVTRFEVSASNQLSMNCRYGPDTDELVTQVNRLGLVENTASLQLLFAEDSDSDHRADRWVKAATWADDAGIVGIRAGVLLYSPDKIRQAPRATLALLDEPAVDASPERLYRAFDTSFAIRGRIQQ